VRRLLLAGLAVLAAWPTSAAAFYGNGATIVSADLGRLEQGDDASLSPDISSDGRYVAFFTRARNFFADDDPDPPGKYRVGGIFRRDLETGALVLVADGDLRKESDDSLLLRGARNPSIAADGRYVAFSTAQSLVAADGADDDIDVYVRDMTVAIRSPGAFTLVSARDGGDVAATYTPKVPPNVGSSPGSDVWPGAAISADGRLVVFRTDGQDSNLPASATTDVPGRQVYVRDLAARTTRLITRDRSTAAPAGGAFGPAGISADGTTVAWTGQNAAAQTPFLNGEIQDPSVNYYLWLRIADGPLAPTRRITGLVDPDDPACPPGFTVNNDPTSQGPCYGPLTLQEQANGNIASQLPSLSSDGWTVAFTTIAQRRPDINSGPPLDLWVTDMRPGVSRKAGSRELTRDLTASDPTGSGPIESAALSADGRYVALTSTRIQFSFPALSPVGTFRTRADVREVYLVDLAAGTIERVTRASSGAETNGEAQTDVSVSADGGRIAFTSDATNLFFGDANGRSDAFVATRSVIPDEAEPPPEPPAPPPPEQDPEPPAPPTLRVSVRRGADKGVILNVRTPGGGRVTVTATARFPAPKKSKKKPPPSTLARVRATARVAGTVVIPLRLSKADQARVRKAKRVSASVKVEFVPAPAGRRLTKTVRVTFVPQRSQ
jgi:Tol biopolymer transport system component